MAYDRESQGPAGGAGVGGTTGTGGTSGFGSTTGGSTGFGGTGTNPAGGTRADDLGTHTGSYDRTFGEESETLKDRVTDKVDEGRHAMEDKLSEGRERVSEVADTGRIRVADQLERVGSRIEERAREMENAGGVQRRAGQVARRASGALDSSADYLRNHEFGEMRDDLESAIRERPLLSVGMAVGAGFLLARILRD